MPIDLDSKEEVEEIIGFNMHNIYIYIFIYHNIIQFYITRSMHIETFVTRRPCAPRENSCTFLGHGRTAHLCVRHNRFCYMTLTLVQKAEQAAFLSIPARSSRSKPEEPSVLIDWHCLTSHCSQTGARNDQNGARLFIAASDRHRNRLNASFLRFQCASMTGSVLSTIATLWLPCSPLYTDFLGLQTVCTKQSSKRIG